MRKIGMVGGRAESPNREALELRSESARLRSLTNLLLRASSFMPLLQLLFCFIPNPLANLPASCHPFTLKFICWAHTFPP